MDNDSHTSKVHAHIARDGQWASTLALFFLYTNIFPAHITYGLKLSLICFNFISERTLESHIKPVACPRAATAYR